MPTATSNCHCHCHCQLPLPTATAKCLLGTACCYCELLNQDYVASLRDPELELYEADGVHPSVLGSYAISLAFYTMIFNADPTEVTYHRDGLNTADEQLLREIVQEVVFDRISEWQ